MRRDLLAHIESFLRGSGFEVTDATSPFIYVAQNSSVLVFVIEAEPDINQTVRNVTTLLASPFRSKQFGPKTMEMYCIFVVEETTPISLIERWERDLKFCRKIFVTNRQQIEARLCFLQPLGDSIKGSLDIDSMFWSQMSTELLPTEVALLKSVGSRIRTIDELLGLFSNKK
jgi:hypothetical protein